MSQNGKVMISNCRNALIEWMDLAEALRRIQDPNAQSA